jgi:hypothetical protein
VNRWFSLRRPRSSRPRTQTVGADRTGALLTGLLAVVILAILVLGLVRHERFMQSRRREWIEPPWNPGWPVMPAAFTTLREDLARAMYAFAGSRPDVLTHIPCYCGCKTNGHRSVHHCFVKRRAQNGVVTEWEKHGLMCPLAPDIAGDAMLWHQQGQSLRKIRQQIDREFGPRGPATDTALPP